MNPKVFEESANVYEDQAKLLADYYLKCAQDIVNEEKEYEKKIEALEVEKKALHAQESKVNLYKWLFCVFIIPFVVYHLRGNNVRKQIADLDDRVAEFNKLKSEIFRDYKVEKIGVVYVPVAQQVRYNDKSFIVDYAGRTDESVLELKLSRQSELLSETINRVKDLTTEAPIVETSQCPEQIETAHYSRSIQQINQNDYFGELERSLRTIKFCLNDIDVQSVALPLVSPDDSYYEDMKEYATTSLEDGATVMSVFDGDKYEQGIQEFCKLNEMKEVLSSDTQEYQDILKGLMTTLARSVQTISTLRLRSTDKVVAESNMTLFQLLKAPYNHYSPALEAEEITRIQHEEFNYDDSTQAYRPFNLKESSRVKYNLVTQNWQAEDGSVTNAPFAIHQIHQEVIAPLVRNLMKENREKRLEIYNHIKDQKMAYLNKWHQDTEDFYGRNRAESNDLINIMRSSLTEYLAAYNTLVSLTKTQENMNEQASMDAAIVESENNSAEILASFDQQAKDFQKVQQDFDDYMERLKEDIDGRAAKFEHINYFDAMLSDGLFKDTAMATAEAPTLDDRRQKLAAVNPLFAKNAIILPEPSQEVTVMEDNSINLIRYAENSMAEIDQTINEVEAADDVDSPENDEGIESDDNESGGNLMDAMNELYESTANEGDVNEQGELAEFGDDDDMEGDDASTTIDEESTDEQPTDEQPTKEN